MPTWVNDDRWCHRKFQDEKVPDCADCVHHYRHSPVTSGKWSGWQIFTSAVKCEDLIEEIRREVPSEEITHRDPEVRSTIAPYPCSIDRGPIGFHRKVPRNHREAGERRNGYDLEPSNRLLPSCNQNGKHPGTIANSEIREDEQNRKAKYLGTHHFCKVVMTKRESCSQA